jgi:hypothetical protein
VVHVAVSNIGLDRNSSAGKVTNITAVCIHGVVVGDNANLSNNDNKQANKKKIEKFSVTSPKKKKGGQTLVPRLASSLMALAMLQIIERTQIII